MLNKYLVMQLHKMHINQLLSLRNNVDLAPLCTFGMGGPADYFVAIKSAEELVEAVKAARADNLPWFLLGWGSNLIFHDLGFRGMVIHNLARRAWLENGLLVAEGGTLLSQIIQVALKNGLVGMEKMMGLPGTIGGAVRGNAGAFGVEIKDFVQQVLVWSPSRGERLLQAAELAFGYRESAIKQSDDLVLRVWLKLNSGDTVAAVEEIRQITLSRLGKQPAGKTCGSFFKNPSGNSVAVGLAAGAAIDGCGLKGFQLGGVKFSEKHANWLMNVGLDGSGKGTKMQDVLDLCEKAQAAVLEKFGVSLEREVQLVGERGKY